MSRSESLSLAKPGAFVVRGALGFSSVSLAAFSVWAFAGRWFRTHGGEGVLYGAVAAVFVLLTGLLLHPLILGEQRLRRFYRVFGPAFVAYALVWSFFWFRFQLGAGEWLGSLLGSFVFVLLVAQRFPERRGLVGAGAVFFIAHSAGYFFGGQAMAALIAVSRQPTVPFLSASAWVTLAKLAWGFFYGLGFGSGLGYLLAVLQGHLPRASDHAVSVPEIAPDNLANANPHFSAPKSALNENRSSPEAVVFNSESHQELK